MVCDILAGQLLTSFTEDNNDSTLRYSTFRLPADLSPIRLKSSHSQFKNSRIDSGKISAHARRISPFRGVICDSSVDQTWIKFAQERTKHCFTLFGTDNDMIRPENFLMESALMEESEG